MGACGGACDVVPPARAGWCRLTGLSRSQGLCASGNPSAAIHLLHLLVMFNVSCSCSTPFAASASTRGNPACSPQALLSTDQHAGCAGGRGCKHAMHAVQNKGLLMVGVPAMPAAWWRLLLAGCGSRKRLLDLASNLVPAAWPTARAAGVGVPAVAAGRSDRDGVVPHIWGRGLPAGRVGALQAGLCPDGGGKASERQPSHQPQPGSTSTHSQHRLPACVPALGCGLGRQDSELPGNEEAGCLVGAALSLPTTRCSGGWRGKAHGLRLHGLAQQPDEAVLSWPWRQHATEGRNEHERLQNTHLWWGGTHSSLAPALHQPTAGGGNTGPARLLAATQPSGVLEPRGRGPGEAAELQGGGPLPEGSRRRRRRRPGQLPPAPAWSPLQQLPRASSRDLAELAAESLSCRLLRARSAARGSRALVAGGLQAALTAALCTHRQAAWRAAHPAERSTRPWPTSSRAPLPALCTGARPRWGATAAQGAQPTPACSHRCRSSLTLGRSAAAARRAAAPVAPQAGTRPRGRLGLPAAARRSRRRLRSAWRACPATTSVRPPRCAAPCPCPRAHPRAHPPRCSPQAVDVRCGRHW